MIKEALYAPGHPLGRMDSSDDLSRSRARRNHRDIERLARAMEREREARYIQQGAHRVNQAPFDCI